MAMITIIRILVLWTIFLMSWKSMYNGQRLNKIESSCSGPDELDFLKEELDVWQKIVKDQAMKVKILEGELNSINEKLSVCIEKRLTNLTNTISKIESKQNIQQSTLQRFEASQSLLERKIDRDIAFTAILLDKNPISNLKKDQKIVFGHVITNRGNAYDNNTGIFLVPKNGLYGFYYNLHTAIGKYAMVELTKNGITSYAYAFSGQHSTGESDGSTFAVLSLMKGERIWLMVSKDCSSGEVLKYQENTFSGFLLHAY